MKRVLKVVGFAGALYGAAMLGAATERYVCRRLGPLKANHVDAETRRKMAEFDDILNDVAHDKTDLEEAINAFVENLKPEA